MVLDECRFLNWLQTAQIPEDIKDTIKENLFITVVGQEQELAEVQELLHGAEEKLKKPCNFCQDMEKRLKIARTIYQEIRTFWETNSKTLNLGPWPKKWQKQK
jgi:hypothetical protein